MVIIMFFSELENKKKNHTTFVMQFQYAWTRNVKLCQYLGNAIKIKILWESQMIKAHLNHQQSNREFKKADNGFLINKSSRSAYINILCMYHAICKTGPTVSSRMISIFYIRTKDWENVFKSICTC